MLKNKVLLILSSAILLLSSSCNRNLSIENPFNGEMIDLPFFTSECGTEYPEFQDRKTVQTEMIVSLKRKGIFLQADYLYQDDSISFVVDGYDPERKIGYIWLNEENLTWQAMDLHFYNGGTAPYDFTINPEMLADDLLRYEHASDSLHRRIQKAFKMKDTIAQNKEFQEIKKQYIIEGIYFGILTKNFKECRQFSEANDADSKEKYLEICLLKQKITRLINTWSLEDSEEDNDYKFILQSANLDSIKFIYNEIHTKFHQERFSLAESEYLLEQQKKGELFIAMINHFDERYNIPFDHFHSHRDRPKVERKSNDHDWYVNYRQKISEKRLAKKRKKLIKDFRAYVRWVESK